MTWHTLIASTSSYLELDSYIGQVVQLDLQLYFIPIKAHITLAMETKTKVLVRSVNTK